jgi:CubicO group peptidase (beta-lactamase class C family)
MGQRVLWNTVVPSDLRIGAVLIAACVATVASAAPSIRRLDGQLLSPRAAAVVADKELKADHVMGAQIAILNRGHLVWTHAYGLRDDEKKLPMTDDTNIWAASITKSVFATFVMGLVETHRFDIDMPVAAMLAKPLDRYASYRDTASDLVRDPRWARVTPRMLLAHMAGLPNFAFLEPDKKLHLHFDPGTRFAYSGEGLNILQLAIEEKLGAPLDVLMQREIFSALGMTRTSMVWREDFRADSALRYGASGKLIGATRRDKARAAGSMASTVNDLARFVEALLADKILQPETRVRMFTPQISINAAHQFPTFDTATSAEGPRVGLAYGIGWGLLTKTKYGPAVFKEGHGDGAENYLICFLRGGSCMIVLTNSDNGELAFRPLLEKLLGDTVTPWAWDGYTHGAILNNEEHASGPWRSYP